MAATLTNDGLDYLTRYVLGLTVANGMEVKLFTNSHTPSQTDLPTNYTECALSGYNPVNYTPGSWSGSTSGGTSVYNYPTITFTFNAYTGSPITIYGYFVVDFATGFKCIFAELFAVPYVVPLSGGNVQVAFTWDTAQY